MSSEGITFSFGSNWREYLECADELSIESARKDIVSWLGADGVKGKTVLDIGSGSGIHSLVFWLLGAKRVLSFDYDTNSVQATRSVWEKAGKPANWDVRHGSILDPVFIQSIESGDGFDIVYAWGVLHHTGAMWNAIKAASSLVGQKGMFWISLYAKGPAYPRHLAEKQKYNRASRLGKKLMELQFIAELVRQRLRGYGGLRRCASALLHGRVKDATSPFRWKVKKARGMDTYHDIVDWMGGLPYEVANVEEATTFLADYGLRLKKVEEAPEGSCHVFLFARA